MMRYIRQFKNNLSFPLQRESIGPQKRTVGAIYASRQTDEWIPAVAGMTNEQVGKASVND